MSVYHDTDRSAIRVPRIHRSPGDERTDEEIIQERDDKARANIKAFASWEPDPAGWEADILAYLGLDQPAQRTSTEPLIDPSDARGRKILKHRPGHGHRACYEAGCRCAECREAQAEYRRELHRRRTEADRPAQAARPPQVEADSGQTPQARAQAARVLRRERARAERAQYLRALVIEATEGVTP